MNGALAVLAGYALGSFPSAYLAGRIVLGADLRTRGSGNLGATNVYREVGLAAAITVLAIDGLKGWAAAALVPGWFALITTGWWPVALGAAAVAGHAKPVFLLGKGGGKGVATSAGVFLALAPIALAIAAGAFALTVALTRYVSAGSLVSAVVLPVAVAVIKGPASPAFIVCSALAAFVIWAHRGNIRKLLRGEERKLGRPGAAR
jgi:glycerol-3-phosphate acyltransferase PlsY